MKNLTTMTKLMLSALMLVATMNANALTINTANAAVKQNPAYLHLAWNGEIGQYVAIPSNGTYRITVRAAGMLAGGVGPDMALRINQSSRQVVRLNHTDYRNYTFDLALNDGVHQVGVAYSNDATIGSEDRNLLVESITISPLTGGGEPTASTLTAFNDGAQLRDADVLATTNALIAENRKAPAQVMVVDANGNPVPGATVEVQQTKSEFLFGANLFGFDAYGSSTENNTYKQRFSETFNYATVPFYWSWMEPVQGQPNYTPVDNMVTWANSKNIAMKGHAVLYGDTTMIPAWAGTPSQTTQMNRISNIFGRYGNSIKTWDLVNEPVSIPGVMAVNAAYSHARSLQPEGKMLVNEYGQFYTGFDIFYGNHYQTLRDYMTTQLAAGMPVDVVGLQAHEPLDTAWSMETVWSTLNQYGALGTDIHITEFSPCSNGNPVLGSPYRGTWTEATQAQFAEDFYRVCFAHADVKAISWWDVSDTGSWLAGGGLLRSNMTAKPAYDRLKNLITNEWRTNASGTSTAQGRFLVDAFHGDYTVKVTIDGVTYTSSLKVTEDGANVASVTVPVAGTPVPPAADTTAPVLTLSGTASMTLAVGTSFVDPGATATDNVSGNVTASIVKTGTVNHLALGTYTLTYNVSDAAGNAAAPVTRTVTVTDTVKPVITLTGSASITIKRYSAYTDAGATATDNYDGNISSKITKTSTVKTGTLGTYTVKYDVKDNANNAATQVTRTVKVVR